MSVIKIIKKKKNFLAEGFMSLNEKSFMMGNEEGNIQKMTRIR
jgi:hypothetical protein